jgi:U6 snRNA-associated Sm-like protein LSm7
MSGFKSDRDAGFDMEKYTGERVRVKFQGGRECEGVLKGFDKLDNLVLEDCVEYLRDPDDSYTVTDKTRKLGLVVCRGTQVCLIAPCEGYTEIENPYEE